MRGGFVPITLSVLVCACLAASVGCKQQGRTARESGTTVDGANRRPVGPPPLSHPLPPLEDYRRPATCERYECEPQRSDSQWPDLAWLEKGYEVLPWLMRDGGQPCLWIWVLCDSHTGTGFGPLQFVSPEARDDAQCFLCLIDRGGLSGPPTAGAWSQGRDQFLLALRLWTEEEAKLEKPFLLYDPKRVVDKTEWSQIAAAFRDARKAASDDPVTAAFAQLCLGLTGGASDHADGISLDELRKVTRDLPQDTARCIVARYWIGRTLEARGQTRQAKEAWREMLLLHEKERGRWEKLFQAYLWLEGKAQQGGQGRPAIIG